LACSLLALGLLACQWFVPAPNATPSAHPLPGVDELRFEDPQTGQRFRQLNACIRDLADASWRTTDYRLLGNFYQSNWCTGSGAGPSCEIANGTMDARDQHILVLNTLMYDPDRPAFGLGLQALWVPKSSGWRAAFWFAEGGQTVIGDGWHLSLSQLTEPSGPPAATVELGLDYSYHIYGAPRMIFDGTASPTPLPTYAADQVTFEVAPDLPLRDDLALYLASPEGMRARGLAKIRLLAHIVDSGLTTHQVMTCDKGPYTGGGIPPACTPRPLTAAEEASELARAQAYFTQAENLLQVNYRDMYAAWMTAFPFNKCWP
jgi:hypothetical protein